MILVVRLLDMEPLHSSHSLPICYGVSDDDGDYADDEEADKGDVVDYHYDE